MRARAHTHTHAHAHARRLRCPSSYCIQDTHYTANALSCMLQPRNLRASDQASSSRHRHHHHCTVCTVSRATIITYTGPASPCYCPAPPTSGEQQSLLRCCCLPHIASHPSACVLGSTAEHAASRWPLTLLWCCWSCSRSSWYSDKRSRITFRLTIQERFH